MNLEGYLLYNDHFHNLKYTINNNSQFKHVCYYGSGFGIKKNIYIYIILLTLYEHCPGALRFVHKSFWGSCLVFSLGGIVLIARTDKETLVVTRHNNDK